MNAAPTRVDPVNILLVDDQPSKLLTYESILGELGENLVKVSSATEALEYLLRNDVAVVLVDVVMPELDGYELAAMIRQHPRFQRTSIIFVSALLLTDLDRLRGYECGAVDYVPVPVVPEILRAKVSVFAELYRKTRALERLNAELEQRVADRTAALEATTAALQEADRRKDEFLAILAHELRNPLAPIRTAVQLLRKRELAEAQSVRAREVIERQVQHLVCLIDDLLDVSRITRGMITLQRERVLLDAVVARAVETARPLIDSRRHELTLELPEELLSVDGDQTRLVQIIGNILHNAAKFMEPGGTILLSVAREESYAVIKVKDAGMGIPKDLVPRIFDLFSQVHQKSDGAQGGLGIGLALVRRLVEMHGGAVSATSEGPGHGTEMVVRLPLLGVAATPFGVPTVESKRPPVVESSPHPRGRRQPRCRRGVGVAAPTRRTRRPNGQRRDGSARSRRVVCAPGRPARSRDAQDGRVRDRAPDPAALVGSGRHSRGPDWLGTAAGPAADVGRRLRRAPRQTGERVRPLSGDCVSPRRSVADPRPRPHRIACKRRRRAA